MDLCLHGITLKKDLPRVLIQLLATYSRLEHLYSNRC